MPWRVQHLGGRAGLDELARVEHQHPVAELGDDSEVVRDCEDGQAAVRPQPCQQLQHLGLDRDVERRGRLIRDEQLRFAGHGDRQHDPLQHAAGELVRVLPVHLFGFVQPHRLQQCHPCLVCLPPRAATLHPQLFGKLVAHGVRRIEVGRRVLEDRGDPRPAQVLPGPPGQLDQRAAGEVDAAATHRATRGQNTEHRPAGQRLATAGLPDDADRLAPPDLERHAAHGFGPTVGHGDPQAVDRQQDAIRRPRGGNGTGGCPGGGGRAAAEPMHMSPPWQVDPAVPTLVNAAGPTGAVHYYPTGSQRCESDAAVAASDSHP